MFQIKRLKIESIDLSVFGCEELGFEEHLPSFPLVWPALDQL